MTPSKVRLDELLLSRGIASNLKMAQALILAGCVIVGDRTVDKVGIPIATDAPIRLRRGAKSSPYVSRGGIKLKAALDHFAIPIAGMIAADVGASTGGFTDCLLQAGARKVYAIDVGYGQLAWSLRQDRGSWSWNEQTSAS